MINYELILVCSAAGFMWAEVLTQEGMMFGFVPAMIVKIMNIECIGRDQIGIPIYNRPLLRALQKPLFSCAICVTGFWTLAILLIIGYETPLIYSLLSMLTTKILIRYA